MNHLRDENLLLAHPVEGVQGLHNSSDIFNIATVVIQSPSQCRMGKRLFKLDDAAPAIEAVSGPCFS